MSPVEIIALLFLVAIIAGFIDSLAGGGGLITLPALIISGMNPLMALGTNKVQSSAGSGMASFVMLKQNRVTWSHVQLKFLIAFLGSVMGTLIVLSMDIGVLNFVIPIVLILIAGYFLWVPLDKVPLISNLKNRTYKTVVIPIIGFYDGMFGPGTGSFFAFSGMAFRGYNLKQSTAIAKPLNFATNIGSLVIFIQAGQVAWVTGIVMMAGQFIGAWLVQIIY